MGHSSNRRMLEIRPKVDQGQVLVVGRGQIATVKEANDSNKRMQTPPSGLL